MAWVLIFLPIFNFVADIDLLTSKMQQSKIVACVIRGVNVVIVLGVYLVMIDSYDVT